MNARSLAFALLVTGGLVPAASISMAAQQTAAPAAATKVVGSITTIDGRTLTVKPDNAAPVTVTVSDAARILRTASTASLAGATSIQLTDLTVGDRVLLMVRPSTDGTTQTATAVVAMKKADVAQQQQSEQADWQRHGVAGIVKSVDASANTVTIAAGSHTWTVQSGTSTVIRRYSPDSNKFADARPSSFDQIHVGDQLHARGERSADGATVTATEIISGSYRNIAGTVVSTDASADTVTVTDLATKKPVVIHVTTDSQLHKLPPTMAQALAARFKNPGANAGAAGGGAQTAAAAPAENPQAGSGGAAGGDQSGQHQGGQRNGDLSQMLQRTPVLQISDLHKGDAVMIVTTQGTPDAATAITMIAGVEPILTASPAATQSMFSASWNLNGGAGGAEGTQ